jgi:Carbamoyltransferase N-terminus
MGPLSSHKALGRVPSAGNRILIGGGRDLARRCRPHCSESGQSVSGSSFKAPVHALEHHAAHLASAFHVSPFEKAVILSIDGFGDFASAAWGVGEGATVRVDGHVYFPHSLSSTRPSPSFSAFRTMATSTRSWGSPRMAGRPLYYSLIDSFRDLTGVPMVPASPARKML